MFLGNNFIVLKLSEFKVPWAWAAFYEYCCSETEESAEEIDSVVDSDAVASSHSEAGDTDEIEGMFSVVQQKLCLLSGILDI